MNNSKGLDKMSYIADRIFWNCIFQSKMHCGDRKTAGTKGFVSYMVKYRIYRNRICRIQLYKNAKKYHKIARFGAFPL